MLILEPILIGVIYAFVTRILFGKRWSAFMSGGSLIIGLFYAFFRYPAAKGMVSIAPFIYGFLAYAALFVTFYLDERLFGTRFKKQKKKEELKWRPVVYEGKEAERAEFWRGDALVILTRYSVPNFRVGTNPPKWLSEMPEKKIGLKPPKKKSTEKYNYYLHDDGEIRRRKLKR